MGEAGLSKSPSRLGAQQVFVFGGWDGSCLDDHYVLDLVTWRWRRVVGAGEVPEGRYGHSAVAQGKKYYVWGGRSAAGACLPCDQVYVFDAGAAPLLEPAIARFPAYCLECLLRRKLALDKGGHNG